MVSYLLPFYYLLHGPPSFFHLTHSHTSRNTHISFSLFTQYMCDPFFSNRPGATAGIVFEKVLPRLLSLLSHRLLLADVFLPPFSLLQ